MEMEIWTSECDPEGHENGHPLQEGFPPDVDVGFFFDQVQRQVEVVPYTERAREFFAQQNRTSEGMALSVPEDWKTRAIILPVDAVNGIQGAAMEVQMLLAGLNTALVMAHGNIIDAATVAVHRPGSLDLQGMLGFMRERMQDNAPAARFRKRPAELDDPDRKQFPPHRGSQSDQQH